MPEAEGRKYDSVGVDAIDVGALEVVRFDNPESEKVVIRTEEFSAVCPFSGLPDIAKLTIEYVPGECIIELKSLKYYLMSYRNVGVYQERATKLIYKDLQECLEPVKLKVTLIYNTRGGMDVTSVIDSTKICKSEGGGE